MPYCTGDVHAGNNPQGVIDTLKPQQFVGYVNMGLYLKRIVPTFPGMTQVLLTGVSAGGFGALANYVQVAKEFDPIPVSLLDDQRAWHRHSQERGISTKPCKEIAVVTALTHRIS